MPDMSDYLGPGNPLQAYIDAEAQRRSVEGNNYQWPNREPEKPAEKSKGKSKSKSDSVRIKDATSAALERVGTHGMSKMFNDPAFELTDFMQFGDKSQPPAQTTEAVRPPEPDQTTPSAQAGGAKQKTGGLLVQLIKALRDPVIRGRLGQLAVAIGGNNDPRVRQPLGARLGQMGLESARGSIMSDALAGRPDQGGMGLLTPEQQTQVSQANFQRQQLAQEKTLKERELGIREGESAVQKGYYTALMGQADATTKKILADINASSFAWMPVMENGKGTILRVNEKTGEWENTGLRPYEAQVVEPLAKELNAIYGMNWTTDIKNQLATIFYPYAAEMNKGDLSSLQNKDGNANATNILGSISQDEELKKVYMGLLDVALKLTDGRHQQQEIFNELVSISDKNLSPVARWKAERVAAEAVKKAQAGGNK